MTSRGGAAITGALVVIGITDACAQDFPVKPVRIVTNAVGNVTDIVSRYLGQRLHEKWGKAIVVENRAGLAPLSAAIVARSQPDGYTLSMSEYSTHVFTSLYFKNPPYDPVKDFAPVTMVMKAPLVLTANPSVPATILREFVDEARRIPGLYKYATRSVRRIGNLSMKSFMRAAGIDMLQVPYKRAADSLTAVMTREVDVSFLATPVALPHLSTGKLKIFAISGSKRFSGAPEVPTVAESGVPGFEMSVFQAVFAPARTPREIIGMINRDITAVLRAPDTQAWMLKQGGEPSPGSPQELEAFIKAEVPRWTKIVRDAGIEPL